MRFRLDSKAFEAALRKAVADKVAPAKALFVGKACRDIIKKRTEAGRDVTGRTFRPYSTTPIYVSKKSRPAPQGGIKTPRTQRRTALYARQTGRVVTASRSKRGGRSVFFPGGYREYKRNIYGRGVNLTLTGRMLGSLYVEQAGPKRFIIGFHGKAENVKARGNQETRPFFGVGRVAGEVDLIQKAWRRANGV
ncbi:MAG: hypothetical protein ACOZEN_06835 [Thermodesulfobacteriota bacterium]